MTATRLFVLGIDGVDLSLAQENDLLLSNTIEWDLEEYPELHTLRIWPSMFTGKLPHRSDNLIDPLSQGKSDDEERLESANWTSQYMRFLSKISHLLLPKSVRLRLGDFFQRRGVIKAGYDPIEWEDTVFDGLLSNTINLPTYNPLPVQQDLKQGWKTKINSGNAGLDELESLASEERKAVWSEIDKALDHGYDLTWAYIYCTDIFGHVDFNYGYQSVTEQVCEEIVSPLREAMVPEDELVIISDHGMVERDGVGEHRPPGWFTTTVDDVDLPATPKDVRPWIEGIVGTQSHNKEETLRDLGYI
jgi:hypothetical protein